MDEVFYSFKKYNPYVCQNRDCFGFGDSTPAEYGKCFLCNKEQTLASLMPFEDLHRHVAEVVKANQP